MSKKILFLFVAILALASVTLFIIKQNNDKSANTQYAANGNSNNTTTNDDNIDNNADIDNSGSQGGVINGKTGAEAENTGVVTIQCVDANTSQPIDGSKVRFISKSTGDDFERTIVNGVLQEELPEGDYLLTESEAADGYNHDGRVQNFTVVKDESSVITLKSTRDESNVSGGTDLTLAEQDINNETIPLSAVDIDQEAESNNEDTIEYTEYQPVSTADDSGTDESKADENPKTSDNSSTFKLILLFVVLVYFVLFGILYYHKKNISTLKRY